MPKSEKIYSISEAANRLGISRQAVEHQIGAGNLTLAENLVGLRGIAESVLASWSPNPKQIKAKKPKKKSTLGRNNRLTNSKR